MKHGRRVFALLSACSLGLFAGCSDAGGGAPEVVAYLASDACHTHTDATACGLDTANGCAWVALEACPEGSTCPEGACVAPDPCAAHGDPTACEADTANGCAWAAIDLLCPAGESCDGGFCHAASDACVCACPLYCPAGTDCPECACDCTGGTGGGTIDGGGGTCTCACPDCAPGETCPPCDCTCSDLGCVDEGTCTCACPVCAPDETCPPCECGCDGTVAATQTSGGATTCECPACTGGVCPACDCGGGTVTDPCLVYTEELACTADTANGCSWIALGVPCQVGETCASGVCQNLAFGGGGTDGCACVCPACEPGADCPPCECDCGSGGGTCTPPSSGTGTVEPAI